MKHLVLLAALPCALLSQSLDGTWQGTVALSPDASMRMVFKVAKEANGYQGTFYNLENGRQGPLGAVTINGTAVKIVVPIASATYEGKLEGDSMTGTISQGATPYTLLLKRATPTTAWELPAAPAAPKPMAADAVLEFEVATIKPAAPGRTGRSAGYRDKRLQVNNYTLLDMITFAYDIHPRQVTELPAWGEEERFDIVAQAVSDGQPTAAQLKRMLQVLIADRLQLVFHREKKEVSVYALTVGPSGHKLKPSSSNEQLPSVAFRGRGNLPAKNASMANLANTLQNSVLDRPVLEQTGMLGRFDFDLIWTPDEFQFLQAGPRPATPAADPNGPPDLFTAMREQLGLKLEATKAAVEVFVIDKVAKPSEN